MEIEEIPHNVDRLQAIANLNLYIKLLSILLWEKKYVDYLKPQLKAVEVYLSPRALPDLLTEGTGPITVLHFLKANCDFELHDIMSELEMDLCPIVEFFRDDQVAEAFDRLIHLRTILEGNLYGHQNDNDEEDVDDKEN